MLIDYNINSYAIFLLVFHGNISCIYKISRLTQSKCCELVG